jgi:hypothetical protein
MKGEHKGKKWKQPVPDQEFDQLMPGIMEQTRGYPQEALEDMFLHLDMIEKKYGVGDTASVELSQE